MSDKNRSAMPMSGAGITRYFEDSENKFRIKPLTVMILIVILALLIIALHVFGGSIVPAVVQ